MTMGFVTLPNGVRIRSAHITTFSSDVDNGTETLTIDMLNGFTVDVDDMSDLENAIELADAQAQGLAKITR